MRLIKLNMQKSEICQTLNVSEIQFLAAVQRLVENGHEISKNYIKMICDIETVDFNQLRSSINDDTLRSGLLGNMLLEEIQLNYQQSTEVKLTLEFIRLMVSYYKVRDHLNQSNIPYFDFDDQILKNAMKLIVDERPISNQNHEENVPPYRNHARLSHFYEDCIWDIMFHHYADYDDYYYNGWSANEGGSADGSEYGSDRESDEHNTDDESDERNSDDDNEHKSDDEYNEPNAKSTDSDKSSNETSPKRHSDSSSKDETSQKRRRL